MGPRSVARLLLSRLLRRRLRASLLLRNQAAKREIVDNVLHALHVILYSVDALAEDVVLEVQQLEPGEEVLDETADLDREGEVAQRDRVGGQAGELARHVGEGEEVLLDGEVEGVTVLEVNRDCAMLSASGRRRDEIYGLSRSEPAYP